MSILPALLKLLEKLIHNVIYPSLHSNIIPYRHGFVRRHSTVTNLLIYVTEFFNNMDNNIQTDTVFTDFRKCFDRVNNKVLSERIMVFVETYGVDSIIMLLIRIKKW